MFPLLFCVLLGSADTVADVELPLITQKILNECKDGKCPTSGCPDGKCGGSCPSSCPSNSCDCGIKSNCSGR